MIHEEMERIVTEENKRAEGFEKTIRVCTAAGCLSSQSDVVKDNIADALKDHDCKCNVKGVGCMGLCSAGPLVSVEDQDGDEKLYQYVKPVDAGKIAATIDGESAEELELDRNIPFFKRQEKIVLENTGLIDPERVEEYIAADGYHGLMQVVTEMSPGHVIDEVVKSGLRGRGGGGYPTGLKWTTVAKAQGEKKYVICNADEGDPGAFMDRSVLEGDPHRVLEGMAIAGFAIGADEGYVYVRGEYPLAVERLKKAIRQAQRMGFLGQNIFGTTFNFNIKIRLGAGAFVCGEETALIASIEGKRGQPRPRPPYPAEFGLWGKPTLINNVESFANIAPIIRNGGDWYASIGVGKSKGTKVFALAGSITNTGLIEVPMGMSLREIVDEIGGGTCSGGKTKAVQTGGPSGGCIPNEYLDTPVEYESLRELGSIMGSGGMIVMDESSCMVDVAKYFMEFCMSESCGKCIPCRAGTVQMYQILDKITRGTATMADLNMMMELGEMIMATSLCGLGQTAPNPVFSNLRYFRDEFVAHIEDKECRAGVCKLKKTEEVTA